MAKEKTVQKIANIWEKVSNPLRYLNNMQIENMLNQARYGNDTKLQVAYHEIEKNNPIFSSCINKRIAGVQAREWDILPDDDSAEAKAQAETIKKMFIKSDKQVEDNFTDAIRHLTLGSFRGRAAVKPFIEQDGSINWKILQNWNFLRYNGKNYWNPAADQVALIGQTSLEEIPKDEICYVYDDKPLDWIGIQIYLKQLIGETSYARFIEKEGIPQVLLTAPDGTPDTDLEKWNYRAQQIFEGGSGCLPSGTTVSQLTAARGQDPFTSFITHQSEMFCILAVGGTLDTLAGTQGSSGTGMGSSTSDHQNEQFNSLVNYDCKRISNAIQAAVAKCVSHMFHGQPIRCHFDFIEQDDTSTAEYLDMLLKLRQANIPIDIQEFKKLTKLSFVQEDAKDLWTPEPQENDK